MAKIYSRTLDRRDGTEGPAHDPYGYISRTVEVNGVKTTLRCGLNVNLYHNGKEITAPENLNFDDREVWKMEMFENIVGMSIDLFDRAYDRVHPYFDDPMGPLSRYF